MASDAQPREGSSSPQKPAESETGRRILFDVGHPAQVHLFRNAIQLLQRGGHETYVTSRRKEVTVDLLDAYGIDHSPLTTRGESMPGLAWELLLREKRLLGVARQFEPDVIVSRLSPAAAHVSALVGCRQVVVSDTRVDSRLMQLLNYRLTLPFVDTVCAPTSLELPVPASKRRALPFQELAYLHPAYFRRNPEALTAHGIDPSERFFLVRLAGWDAYHDVGHRGLSPAATRELVSVLSEHGRVFLSAEDELPPELERYRLPTPPESIHHVLAYADLYVGDSGTMSTEAALLGTPAIRTNTMVDDDESVFEELEERYGLLESFAEESDALAAVRDLLESSVDEAERERRRNRLVDEQPDVTATMVKAILKTGDRE